jgi:hypothetical protein
MAEKKRTMNLTVQEIQSSFDLSPVLSFRCREKDSMKLELVVFLCAADFPPVLLLRRLSSIPSLAGITMVLSMGVNISTTLYGIAVAITWAR